MKILLRTIKIAAVFIIVIAVALAAASFILQDKVTGMVLKSLNKEILTKFEFSSAHLSFLRRFPRASIDIKNVLVHSSDSFAAESFGKINTDTLLFARSVTGEFSMSDIIKGNYNIDRLVVRQGKFNVFTDNTGMVNYEITSPSDSPESDNLTINLDRIYVSDIKYFYKDLGTKLIIGGYIKNGSMKSRISGSNIDFTASGKLDINNFSISGFSIRKNIEASADVILHSSPEGIRFKKGNLEFDRIYLGISGFISEDDFLDLSVNGENINISGIKKYLPEKFLEKIEEYEPSGILQLRSTVKGKISRTLNPAIDIGFDLSKGHISCLNSALDINSLVFKGHFSNGPSMSSETSVLTFDDLFGVLGSAQFSGAFSISDFKSPECKIKLDGKFIPSEFREFFHMKNVSTAKGDAVFSISGGGRLPTTGNFSFTDLFNLNPEADITFNSFGIGLHEDSLLFEDINGQIAVSDLLTARDLRFTTRKHDFRLNGTFRNLPAWLAGKPVALSGKASLTASGLRPGILFPSLADSTSLSHAAFKFPGDIYLDLTFSFDKFEYRTFSAANIKGTLSYKPGIINFKSLTVNSMDGTISGNGFVIQNKDKSFLGRGTFDISMVDINKAFRYFSNFGQDFIKAENLAGLVSGNISVLIPADSMFSPKIKSISAEGSYSIDNGALLNFKPIEELSSFIELSELKDIHFQNLSNDILIRNNYVYIPLMDVKSTAADLVISGKHSFDDNYEYHIKVLLSQMLSRKIRKPKPNSTEFGAVTDDGLGRTSMLLKVVNKGEDIKVSYDIKAAGNQIKNDIKNERKTLKSILNEEYGWFKKDSVTLPDQKASSPKIKVLWGDADTTKTDEMKSVEKESNPLKNIFKKSK
jgi:hypothetical protein